MGDPIRCSNIIRQINDHSRGGLVLTSNIGLKNGVVSRLNGFSRMWAWCRGASYDNNKIAATINKIFQNVNVSHLNVSQVELETFCRSLSKLGITFRKNSVFDQPIIPTINKVSTYVLQKRPSRRRGPTALKFPSPRRSTEHQMTVPTPLSPSEKPVAQKKKHVTSSVALQSHRQYAKLPSYMITGNPRPGKTHLPIRIPIAKVSDLRLTESNLPEIFRRANEVTVNTQYAVQNTSRVVAGKMVHRPNHNGTHSARQARHLEALFSLVKHRGSNEAKGQLGKLSQSEKLNLSLAAYFLRAGRVDESSHKNPPADDYYTRSAMIYEQYAKQMGENPATIAWTKKLMINSCKPSGVRDADIDTNPKNRFGYEVLTMVHELDLIRCFGKSGTARTVRSMRSRLDYFVSPSHSGSKDQHMNQFMQYAKDLCKATGCSRTYDSHRGNAALFAKSSLQGDFCWSQMRAQGIPRWT